MSGRRTGRSRAANPSTPAIRGRGSRRQVAGPSSCGTRTPSLRGGGRRSIWRRPTLQTTRRGVAPSLSGTRTLGLWGAARWAIRRPRLPVARRQGVAPSLSGTRTPSPVRAARWVIRRPHLPVARRQGVAPSLSGKRTVSRWGSQRPPRPPPSARWASLPPEVRWPVSGRGANPPRTASPQTPRRQLARPWWSGPQQRKPRRRRASPRVLPRPASRRRASDPSSSGLQAPMSCDPGLRGDAHPIPGPWPRALRDRPLQLAGPRMPWR